MPILPSRRLIQKAPRPYEFYAATVVLSLSPQKAGTAAAALCPVQPDQLIGNNILQFTASKMARQKKTSSKNRSFLLPVAGLLCFAAAGLWWMSSAPVAETTSAPPASQPDPYEQFVASSLKNGWTPTDPVEKLSATVAKFGQVLEPADLKSSNDLLKMLVQEFEYVVKVLIRTPKRKFDLSHLLEDTLEMLKIAYFKSMKHQLKAGAR